MIPTSGVGGAAVAFNPSLHPRVAAGSAGGGRFAAKGGGSAGSTPMARKPAVRKAPGKKSKAVAPNGLGYSAKQWANLQKLEAEAHAGKKLDAHQLHELHVAHEKHLAAIGKAPKPARHAKAAAKPKTARKHRAKSTTARTKAAPKPTTAAQIKANAAAFRL